MKVGYLRPRRRRKRNHTQPVSTTSCWGWWRSCVKKDWAPWSILHVPTKAGDPQGRGVLPEHSGACGRTGTSEQLPGEPGSSQGEGMATPPITGWCKQVLGHPRGPSVGESQPGPPPRTSMAVACGAAHGTPWPDGGGPDKSCRAQMLRWEGDHMTPQLEQWCSRHLPSPAQSLSGQHLSRGAVSLSPPCTSTARSQAPLGQQRDLTELVPSLLGPLLCHCHQIHQLCWHGSPSTSPLSKENMAQREKKSSQHLLGDPGAT